MSFLRRLLIVVSLCLSFSVHAADGNHRLLVFAAASLREAVGAVIESYGTQYDTRVLASYASSSTLARQITQGAEADVYISANPQWMDYLSERDAIAKHSRRNLLGNELVLITQRRSTLEAEITDGFDLRGLLGKGYLAMGDPAHVPAGRYGQAALESLGVWKSVADRIARADNVRAALALVAHGEAPFGIVYRSDAVADDRVRVVDSFPCKVYPPIIYPVARVSGSNHPAADTFLEFLQTPEAADTFRRYGFDVLK